MDPFRLTFTTLLARKSWVIVFVAAILLPIVLPYFTPYEANLTLLGLSPHSMQKVSQRLDFCLISSVLLRGVGVN